LKTSKRRVANILQGNYNQRSDPHCSSNKTKGPKQYLYEIFAKKNMLDQRFPIEIHQNTGWVQSRCLLGNPQKTMDGRAQIVSTGQRLVLTQVHSRS
jgi:hypothetical protein